jgi:hypothetical protein
VVALGNPEVPVGVLVLRDAVRRVRRADGEHARRAVGSLLPTELLDLAFGRRNKRSSATRC